MNSDSNYDPSPLCCCEYIDINGERNHILTCCCNCAELDKLVDNIICCRGKRKSMLLLAFCRAFSERMRIPWWGGAKQIGPENVLPMVLTFLIFAIAAQGWTWMFLSFFLLILYLNFPQEFFFSLTIDTSFHSNVFYSSIMTIVFVYELYVVPQLEISYVENMVFVVLMIITAIVFYIMWLKRPSLDLGQTNDALVWSRQCPICKIPVHSNDFHSIWFRCCIGIQNRLWYVLCLGTLMSAVFDCSYLTLTTVCRPYELIDDFILVPQDCDEVFIQWRYAICFVSGVFSLFMSGVFLILLVREVIFISIGYTITEWRCLPLYQKICLGLNSHCPHSKGFYLNWYQVFRRSYI